MSVLENSYDYGFSFYVIDDLRKNGYHMEHFDNLQQALELFAGLDDSGIKMPTLGIQKENSGLDLIHRLNGENVLVQDYKNSSVLSDNIKSIITEIDTVAKELIDKGIAGYRYCNTILPWRDYAAKVIAPIVANFVPEAYCNDKILKAGDGIPATSINEILIDGEGWVKYKDFLKDPSQYVENGVLKVERVNVAYVKSDRFVGVDGQMDLSIDNFEVMAEKINKPYYISVSDMKNSRYERSNFAIASFDTLPEAVKAWYEINDKIEYTPGVVNKAEGCSVFNGCNENLEEISYETASKIYGFEPDKEVSKDTGLRVEIIKPEERSYTFRQSEGINNEAGFIGFLRADFGSGKEFWSTWNEFSSSLKTTEFSSDLDKVINALRFDENYNGILKDRDSLARYCWSHRNAAYEDGRNNYGVRVDTDKYSYLLRLNPNKGDYNLYCYCYEKDLLNEHLHNAEKIADVDKLINNAIEASKTAEGDGKVKDNIQIEKE